MELATDRQRQQDPIVQPPAPVAAEHAPTPAAQQATVAAGTAAVARMGDEQAQATAATATDGNAAAQPAMSKKQPSAAAIAQAASIAPGTVARLTSQIVGQMPDGKVMIIPAGTLVTVVGVSATNAGKVTVQTQAGLVVDTEISPTQLKVEPQVMNTELTTAKYGQLHGNLWDPTTGPVAEDARAQGLAGDCYFISSMAALCAQNPKQIEALFNVHPKPGEPVHKSYTIKLWKPDAQGNLKPTSTKVDRYVPESPQNQIDYDGYNTTMPAQPGANAPKHEKVNFWPELLEKAFAQVYGSYENIGEGGLPAAALEALTGVAADEQMTPDVGGNMTPPPGMDAGTYISQKFKAFEAQKRAVVVGTKQIGEDPATGPFGLVGGHAYQFVRTEGTDLIFKNPWGIDDPQPVPADKFTDCFFYIGDTLGSMPVKAGPDGAGGGTRGAQVANDDAPPATLPA